MMWVWLKRFATFTCRRTRPGRGDAAGDAPRGAPEAISAQLRKPMLWLIGLRVALIMGVNSTIAISLVPIAIAQGVPMIKATMMVTALSATAVAAKMLLAAFGARADKIKLAALLFVLAVPVNVGLILANDFGTLLACAASVGLIAGTIPALLQIILVDTFGMASYGTVRGLTTPMVAICTALCARFAGQVYDRTHDYDYTFGAFIGLQLIAAAMMLSAGRVSSRSTSDMAVQSS